jgi:hypothetical protein
MIYNPEHLEGYCNCFMSDFLSFEHQWPAQIAPDCTGDIAKILQVLWEVFASNVTHCEVEVSTASHQPSNQRAWGGETGH